MPRSGAMLAAWSPNSALDRTVRPVTPVARGQRARQSAPPVSASVRQHTGGRALVGVALLLLLPIRSAALSPPTGFEEQFRPTVSPSGKRTAYLFVKTGKPDEPRQLWVVDEETKASQLVFRYQRNASAVFSGDDRFLAVSDESGSDLTQAVLFEQGKDRQFRPSPIDIDQVVRAAFRRSYRQKQGPDLYHIYCIPRAWSADSRFLLLSLSGHSDAENWIDSWYVIVNVETGQATFDLSSFNQGSVCLRGMTLRPQ